jgi:hypothetical protein
MNARMDTSDHGLSHHFKGPEAVANGFKKRVGEAPLYSKLELNTFCVLSVPTGRAEGNLKD